MLILRSEDEFDKLYASVKDFADRLETDISPAAVLRVTRPPKRFESSSTSSPNVLDAKTNFRKEYYSALDLVISEIERRFSQSGLQKLVYLPVCIIMYYLHV